MLSRAGWWCPHLCANNGNSAPWQAAPPLLPPTLQRSSDILLNPSTQHHLIIVGLNADARLRAIVVGKHQKVCECAAVALGVTMLHVHHNDWVDSCVTACGSDFIQPCMEQEAA